MLHRFDLGYPVNFGDPHFGLYNRVLDCFLITTRSLADARETQHLASSRYDLYMVDLVSAVNYAPNLIDNQCCHAWSLASDRPLPLGDLRGLDDVLAAKELIPSCASDPDIQPEKTWLQMMLYWRSFVRWIKTDHSHYERYQRLRSFIGTDIQEVWQSVDHLDSVSRTRLYLGTDTRDTNQTITALVNADDFLCTLYQTWKRQSIYFF
jgi:hypothetical protein